MLEVRYISGLGLQQLLQVHQGVEVVHTTRDPGLRLLELQEEQVNILLLLDQEEGEMEDEVLEDGEDI